MTNNEPAADVVEAVARVIAKADGLNFDEVCGYEAEKGECNSGTCIAAHYEDHDFEWEREVYRRRARAALSAIPAPSGQPVAWMYTVSFPDGHRVVLQRYRRTHYDGYPVSGETPLYAAPQPTPAQIRADALREAAALADFERAEMDEAFDATTGAARDRNAARSMTAARIHKAILALIGMSEG